MTAPAMVEAELDFNVRLRLAADYLLLYILENEPDDVPSDAFEMPTRALIREMMQNYEKREERLSLLICTLKHFS